MDSHFIYGSDHPINKRNSPQSTTWALVEGTDPYTKDYLNSDQTVTKQSTNRDVGHNNVHDMLAEHTYNFLNCEVGYRLKGSVRDCVNNGMRSRKHQCCVGKLCI